MGSGCNETYAKIRDLREKSPIETIFLLGNNFCLAPNFEDTADVFRKNDAYHIATPKNGQRKNKIAFFFDMPIFQSF